MALADKERKQLLGFLIVLPLLGIVAYWLYVRAPQADAAGMPTVDAQDVRDLERRIDLYNEVLQPLDSFTLPGGNLLNSYAHIARTVCRRLERIVIRLHEKEPVDRQVRAWLNRLSDYFFVYSRWVIQQLGDSEFLWQKECS